MTVFRPDRHEKTGMKKSFAAVLQLLRPAGQLTGNVTPCDVIDALVRHCIHKRARSNLSFVREQDTHQHLPRKTLQAVSVSYGSG